MKNCISRENSKHFFLLIQIQLAMIDKINKMINERKSELENDLKTENLLDALFLTT